MAVTPRAWSAVSPAFSIEVSAPAGLLSADTSSERETRLASSHAVVAIAVPIAPHSVRRKLINPAAEVCRCAGTELSASAVSPTKKKGMPMPWRTCGSASVQ